MRIRCTPGFYKTSRCSSRSAASVRSMPAALAQIFVLEGVSQVIFTGVAGGVAPGLKVGDIVVSRDALQHDADVRALGYALGEVPGEPLSWAADETLQEVALASAQALTEVTAGAVKVVSGRVLSGDQFIADKGKVTFLFETFGGACAEMEGAAVAQVCSRAGVPFVIVRSLSDSADGGAEVDFRAFTPLARAAGESSCTGHAGASLRPGLYTIRQASALKSLYGAPQRAVIVPRAGE